MHLDSVGERHDGNYTLWEADTLGRSSIWHGHSGIRTQSEVDIMGLRLHWM